MACTEGEEHRNGFRKGRKMKGRGVGRKWGEEERGEKHGWREWRKWREGKGQKK